VKEKNEKGGEKRGRKGKGGAKKGSGGTRHKGRDANLKTVKKRELGLQNTGGFLIVSREANIIKKATKYAK
jgi:hypothetical protein